MKPSYHSILYMITAVLCFLVGYYSSFSCSENDGVFSRQHAPHHVDQSPSHLVPTSENGANSIYREQLLAMHEFQEFVAQQQGSISHCSRFLTLTVKYSGGDPLRWVDSMEIMVRALKVALSTERRLVLLISGDDDGSFCKYPEHDVFCAFVVEKDDLARCEQNMSYPQNHANAGNTPLRQGIQESESNFFNVRYYGPDPIAVLPDASTWPWPKTWLLDSGLSWERSWGAWWVWSQLMYYLYESSLPEASLGDLGIANEASKSLKVTLIWDLTAQYTVRQRFARDSVKTHAWDRIRRITNHVRSEFTKEDASTDVVKDCIFMVILVSDTELTNHQEGTMVPLKSFEDDGWKVLTLPLKNKGTPQKDMLEMVRYSDFIIGSFSSSWFRVAACLNTVNSLYKTPVGTHRHISLDIEWLEALSSM